MKSKRRPTPRDRQRLRWFRTQSQEIRAAWLQRTQPATVTLACAANHLVSLGQARDEMERKA